MKNKKLDKRYQKKYFEGRQRNYSGDIRAPVIKQLSKKYIGQKVLDIGAGSGALIELIPGAIGIDLTPRHPRVQKGDISQIPFEAQSFDTVFALEVLEHLDDDTLRNGLQEAHRVVKEKGTFIATIPHEERLKEDMVMCPKCETWFHKDGHVRSFNIESIEKLLSNNSFKIILLRVLPLGSFARHSFLKNFWKVFNFLNLGFKPDSIFVIAQKI